MIRTMADYESGSRKTSFVIYGVLVLWTAIVAAMSQFVMSPAVRGVAWPQVAIAILGFLGVWLLRSARLPEFLNGAGPLRIFGFPFLIGLVFGCINVICVQTIMPVDRGGPMPPFLQPFPWSLALFSAGAVVMEAMFRLIPLPLITAALLRISRSPNSDWPFWIASAVVVAAETFLILQEIPPPLRILIVFLAALSVIQVILFKKFGYLASLFTRLGHYAVWHIGFGIWFQSSVS